MIHYKKTILTFISAVILLATVCIVAFAEDTAKDKFADPYGDTMCAARKGYWHEAPENSVKAVKLAVGYGADIVEIDVKQTADGVLVLMCDDTVTRTCSGQGEKINVNELTYSELSELKLKAGEGGTLAAVTDETVPALKDVLTLGLDCLYLIDADKSLKDDIYSLCAECGALDSVIFMLRGMSPDEITEWKGSLPTDPMTMAHYKGNIIFIAASKVTKSASSSESILLETKVPYGVNFGKTVMGKADGKIRAVANAAEPNLCGTAREDSEVWWDDLISRGYSVIITDYTPQLREYIDSCNAKKAELQNVYDEYVNNWELPDYKSDKYHDYKLAYNNASELSAALLKDGSSARSDIVTAIYELRKAYEDIINDHDNLANGTAGMTVTPVRVIICIVAVCAVAAAEVYVYKKKKKS